VVARDGAGEAHHQPPFLRPTGGLVRSDGTLLVADEMGGDIALRSSDGTLQTLLTGLNAPDDVLGDEVGNVYINSIGDGVLHRLQGTTHKQLITGLNAPHGLAFDLDGNLLVTDLGGGGRLIKVFVRRAWARVWARRRGMRRAPTGGRRALPRAVLKGAAAVADTWRP
jgi:sugar lactone lactonase YvrE